MAGQAGLLTPPSDLGPQATDGQAGRPATDLMLDPEEPEDVSWSWLVTSFIDHVGLIPAATA